MSGRARRGGEEGEARSAVLYRGSLTVPRAEAAGTRGRGVPGDGAWHWDVSAPDTVSTPPIGSARALSSGASHPAPSPWVELGSTQGVVWCGVVWCGVVWCGVPKALLLIWQWPDCLAHRKMQNRWALILNAKSNPKPCARAVGGQGPL